MSNPMGRPESLRAEGHDISVPMDVDTFTAAYIECALWSSTDDYGNRLDCDDTVLSPEATARLMADCEAFCAANISLLSGLNSVQCGCDFWLTRNRHGVGFSDRDLGPVGEALTRASIAAGSCDLYVGYDGQIHVC